MKLSTIFVGALATVATAAPAKVEEEKRSVGSFGGVGGVGVGVDAFALGGVASLGAPLFGQAGFAGSVFGADVLGAFNNFDIANQALALLAFGNGFNIQSLFTLFDLSIGVNGFNNIFNLGVGNFIDLGSILQLQSVLTFQWLLGSFGNELFFNNAAFGGFNSLAFPQLDFSLFSPVGLSLSSQFAVDTSLLDLSLLGGFGAGFGVNSLSQFNFQNLGFAGSSLVSGGGFLKE